MRAIQDCRSTVHFCVVASIATGSSIHGLHTPDATSLQLAVDEAWTAYTPCDDWEEPHIIPNQCYVHGIYIRVPNR